LKLLIERVIVGEDTLEIRHVIPLGRPKLEALAPAQPGGPPGAQGLDEPPLGGEAERLCSDGVLQTLLAPGYLFHTRRRIPLPITRPKVT
jgi:hypothetical protein